MTETVNIMKANRKFNHLTNSSTLRCELYIHYTGLLQNKMKAYKREPKLIGVSGSALSLLKRGQGFKLRSCKKSPL